MRNEFKRESLRLITNNGVFKTGLGICGVGLGSLINTALSETDEKKGFDRRTRIIFVVVSGVLMIGGALMINAATYKSTMESDKDGLSSLFVDVLKKLP